MSLEADRPVPEGNEYSAPSSSFFRIPSRPVDGSADNAHPRAIGVEPLTSMSVGLLGKSKTYRLVSPEAELLTDIGQDHEV